MAKTKSKKSRKSRKIRRAKPKRKKKDHFEKVVLERKKTSTFAYFLALTATILLFAFGFLAVFYTTIIMEALVKASPATTLTAKDLSTYGITWLILGCLLLIVNFRIRRKASRSRMWFLFILAILTIFLGRPLVALLVAVSAIVYLTRDDRLRKMMETKT